MTPQPLNSEPVQGPVEGRGVVEIRADLARVPGRGEPLPDMSFHGWVGVACRLRDDVEGLLAEVEAAHRFERSVAVDSAEISLAQQFLDAIVAERHRAHAKHGVTSMEQSDDLAHRRVSILLEEIAECAKALNDHEHGELYLEPTRNGWHGPGAEDELDKELIQVGAMAYTWWANRHGDRLGAPAAEL